MGVTAAKNVPMVTQFMTYANLEDHYVELSGKTYNHIFSRVPNKIDGLIHGKFHNNIRNRT